MKTDWNSEGNVIAISDAREKNIGYRFPKREVLITAFMGWLMCIFLSLIFKLARYISMD